MRFLRNVKNCAIEVFMEKKMIILITRMVSVEIL